jgi:N-6 DNA Methylase
VYEFFLGEFSAMQGKAGGEQYTPRCMVTLMVEMIEPFKGAVYDPCCGTGGFYVQSNRFVLAHSGRVDDIAVYGQERNPETYRLARMNLAIRVISGDLRWNNEGTLLKDAFPDARFASVMANPPAQGETLGMWPTPSSSPERAQSGRWGINIIRCRPFRAENFSLISPGAMPRAIAFCPVGTDAISIARPMALPFEPRVSPRAIAFRPVGTMIPYP